MKISAERFIYPGLYSHRWEVIGETIALRENVESNNLSMAFVEDVRNHFNAEVVEPNEVILGGSYCPCG